jgi:hypothetical protein
MIKGNALGHRNEKEKKTGAAMPLRSGWQHEGLVTDPPHATLYLLDSQSGPGARRGCALIMCVCV